MGKVITKKYARKSLNLHSVCPMDVLKFLMIILKDSLIKKVMYIHGELYCFRFCLKEFPINLPWESLLTYLKQKSI